MTDKQIIIDDQKKTIHRLQQECTEKTNAIIALGEQLKRKEQECEELKKQVCGLRPELKYIIDKTCSKYNIEAKYYHEKIVEIINNLDKLSKTLTKIKGIAEPYRMTIKKICGNCKKYNGYYAYCYKDINYYKDTSSETNACEEFTYLDELIPNILANNILQKISEVE